MYAFVSKMHQFIKITKAPNVFSLKFLLRIQYTAKNEKHPNDNVVKGFTNCLREFYMEKSGNFYLFGCSQNTLQNFLSERIACKCTGRISLLLQTMNIEHVLDFSVCLMKIISFLVPDDERMLKRAGEAIDNFKDMVFPSGYDPGAKKRVISEFLDQFGE